MRSEIRGRLPTPGLESYVYNVVVETQFSATHHIRLHNGTQEPAHGHDWRVRATFAQSSLDELGMVIDFADAKRVLNRVVQDLDYRNLNEVPMLQGKNPTAEVVAEWIYRRILELGMHCVAQVEVTEAPGCVAVFRSESA